MMGDIRTSNKLRTINNTTWIGQGPDIHDFVAKSKEFLGGQRLSEEVRQIIIRLYIRNHNFAAFHHLANIKVPTIDMFRAGMVFRVVGQISRTFVILREG